MNRRGFLGFLGLSGAAASVKQSVTLPDTPDAVEKFAAGALMQPAPVELRAGRQQSMGYWYDIQDGILYDRIRFAPGATLPAEIRYFLTPVGRDCPYTNVVKTHRHTNMYSHGSLEAPREFLARRIIFAVHPSASTEDVSLISSEAYWEFMLLNKNMARGPMLLNGPARAGLRDIVGIDGKPKDPLPDEVLATSRDHATLGSTLIPTQAYFEFRVMTPDRVTLQAASAGGRGLDLLIGFVGLDARAVQ